MLPHLVRILLVMLVLTVACLYVKSQKQNMLLVIKDSANKQPLAKATVVIISRKDPVLIDFGITDSLGKYLFKNINIEMAGFVVASVTGYNDRRIPLAMPVKTGNIRLNDISIEVFLSQKYALLEEVVVNGRASPIRMNKDTLEFDADFFKSHPNAVLEDLLRKLPGVEVRQGNQVYVNGRQVNKILIDGREFFSSDPAVILKNLPAELIAKVQVADEKNTIAKETRQQKDIPTIINIKLKKEIKGGMFGKYFAGRGTDNRYEAGGILNAFRDTLQISLIGFANNGGEGGFSMQELNDLGGFNRSGNLGGQNSGDLTRRYSQGIETRNGTGVNVNYDFGKKLQLNGQYFYNQTKQRTASEWLNQQFISDSVLLSNGTDAATNKESTHKVSAGLKWKQDSTGYLTIQVNTEFYTDARQGAADWKTFSKTVPLLSGSHTVRNNRDVRNNLSANANYSKTFVPLHLDWSLNASFLNVASNAQAGSDNRYIRINNNFLPYAVIQQQDNSTPGREVNISNNFNKNWKDKNTLSWKVEYANRQEAIGGDTYQFSEITQKNELLKNLSVKLMLHKQRLNNQFSYRYSYKELTIQPGISIRSLVIQNRYNYDTIPVLNRTYNLISPMLNINYKGLGISYSCSLQEPYSYSLKPVTDSSNPLYTTSGNPDLKPAKNSNYSLSYYKFFNRPKINLNIWGSINHQTDATGDSRQVFADGKTVQTFINLKSVNSYNGSINISKSYNKKNWNYNTAISNAFDILASPIMLNQQFINIVRTSVYPSVSAFAEYKNKYRWQAYYRINFSRSRSNDSALRNANTIQHTLSNTLHFQLFRRLSWDANVNYNLNPGAPAGYKKQWLFCDMAVTLSLLRKDRAQVKLSGFDIFNQNQGVYRFIYQNYIIDNKSLVQKQYFMLTLLYTVKKL